MKTSDFNYHLPQERIAQTPVEPRHSSRLMVINRLNKDMEHVRFSDLQQFLKPGDLLVVNQTRVIPARLFAHKVTGGKVEILLLRQLTPLDWQVMVGGKGLKTGINLTIEHGPQMEIIEELESSKRIVRFAEPIEGFFKQAGHMPLPPYIRTRLDEPERYQTVYARETGSAAAPTAGLHFTEELINSIKAQGINIAELTLHVGLDTFAPVKEEDPREHEIHTEFCELNIETAELIRKTKASGGRIIAVGTTSVRTLESAARDASPEDIVQPFSGATNLFILPGYEFKVVDAMITNFHLPCSTLLMLVSAFAGRERMLSAYEKAVQEEYRFYSFGDAMFIQ
ncbi:MAG: tRNA preQ1(34) S-adenosylmethionine ribosyltransferase-isomerase QueA [Anaerolineaceae bacterium]|nr:tRNA preQ1(34) S-adenosylmethionine ribosyltransferase-isomerase QueA [Anaerolineaceae bacterium]